jgi:hypothetical protein
LPTPLPTGVPTSALPTNGLPTNGLPTGVPTSGTVALPTIDVTQVLDDLTGGPTPVIPLPSVDVTQLLGGVGSALPTAITDPLGDLLP